MSYSLSLPLSVPVCVCRCVLVALETRRRNDAQTKISLLTKFFARYSERFGYTNACAVWRLPPGVKIDKQRNENENQKPKTRKQNPKPICHLSHPPQSLQTPHPPTKSNRNSEVHIEIQNRNDAPSALRRKKIEKTCINKERVNDKNTTTITIATTRNKTTTKKAISYSNHVAFHPLSAAVRSWHIRCECRAGEHLQLLLLPKSFGKLQL